MRWNNTASGYWKFRQNIMMITYVFQATIRSPRLCSGSGEAKTWITETPLSLTIYSAIWNKHFEYVAINAIKNYRRRSHCVVLNAVLHTTATENARSPIGRLGTRKIASRSSRRSSRPPASFDRLNFTTKNLITSSSRLITSHRNSTFAASAAASKASLIASPSAPAPAAAI